ncbi:MAG: DNA mismatch repair protein MutS [Candidatus Buchananbacteria bacterium]|nr:DNA mismatch repair protein MutS [Candidatus Buchananbacteria bacterium]
MANLTPMLKQYREIKNQHKDSILFFRLGDFYEMFGQDAIKAAKILNITLTARNKGTANETPMCGIPYHAAESYIAKLTKAGEKVAICEQVTAPDGQGIVKREVIRIITPGTTLDTNLLNNNQNNFLVSIAYKDNQWGLGFVDLTTGEYRLAELNKLDDLLNELNRIAPSEIIITPDLNENLQLRTKLEQIANLNVFYPSLFQTATETIKNHFKIKSLQSFGVQEYDTGIEAAGNLLNYLKDTQKTTLEHINRLSLYNISDCMILDESTIRNLEILYTYQFFEEKGSLLSIIDQTQTGMGGRLLRNWLLHPLINLDKIQQRLDTVEEFYNNFDLRENFKKELKNIADIERLIGRLGCNRANARDLLNLKNSLQVLPQIKKILKPCQAKLFKQASKDLNEHQNLVKLIDQAIYDDPPLLITDGGIIADGYNQELDELRKISTSGKDWLKELQQKEIERTGISSLKVKFNKIFGYYIEVSNTNLSQVPEDYTRKQTLVNAERFVTPELKEYETKVLGAEEKIKELEQKLFWEIRDQVAKEFETIQQTAKIIAQIDALLSFANIALVNNYNKPQINNGEVIEIKNGRHPVIEQLQSEESYVPNDGLFNQIDHQLILLTGPNMSGKSSYLRQTALIVLLAQIGSFVPAQKATIGLTDRIFTRVGASDNLIRGQSTFMVEMQEAANILNNATDKSLIILDELGRGTSTFDGVSIAWAIVEYIYKNIKAKTLFATHYHELIDMVQKLDKAQNYAVSVKETETGVIFLRKIIPGGIDKSYGIEVAKLAGLPKPLTDRAYQILEELENELHISNGNGKKSTESVSLRPFEDKNEVDLLKNELDNLDPDQLTPIEALQKIKKLKEKLK